MKKLYLLSIIFLSISLQTQAQQIPNFRHYVFQPAYFNPAQVGSGFIAANYRKQWMELMEDAPTSYFVMADVSSLLNLQDKRIGLGVRFLGDQSHIIKRNDINLSFSYYLINDSDHVLSAGVLAGFLSQRLEFGQTLLNNGNDLTAFTDPANGSMGKSAFNGGLGIAYRINPSGDHQWNLDVVLPQLFTSDLNYESGALMDIQPFALFRASYKYNSEAFGFEPIVMYREALGEKQLKKGNIDVGARAFFLEDNLWLGGSYRLAEAEATSINFGIVPSPELGLEVIGTFEIGPSELGSTFEVGVLYQMGKVCSTSDLDFSKNVIINNIDRIELDEEQIQQSLDMGNRSLDGINLPSVSEYSRKERLENARVKLKEAGEQLQKMQGKVEIVTKAKTDADKKIAEAGEECLVKSSSYKKISSGEQRVVSSYQELSQAVQSLKNRINEISKIVEPSLPTSIRRKNLALIRDSVQATIDMLINKPIGMSPVLVIQTGSELAIQYEFPNVQDSYSIDNLDGVGTLLDHLSGQINYLQNNGIIIRQIAIKAIMRDAPGLWGVTSGRYDEEQPLIVSYIRNSTNATTTIQSGFINMEQLALAKMYYMQTYMRERIDLNKIPMIMQIRGPYEQNLSQLYQIEIIIE